MQVFKRNIFNKEKGVDMRMGLDIGRLVIEKKPPAVIALVAGDGDFLPVVEDAKNAGWKVEVWYWSKAAYEVRTNADRFESLDSRVYKIGFDEKSRLHNKSLHRTKS